MYTVTLIYANEDCTFKAKAVDSILPNTIFIILKDQLHSLAKEWVDNKGYAVVTVDEPGKQTNYMAMNPKYDEDKKTIRFSYGKN